MRVQRDKVTGKQALLYPEGVLLLNPTGAAVVELCDGRHTLVEMVSLLAERYAAPPDRMSEDLTDYLSRLRDRGLLQLLTDEDSGI